MTVNIYNAMWVTSLTLGTISAMIDTLQTDTLGLEKSHSSPKNCTTEGTDLGSHGSSSESEASH